MPSSYENAVVNAMISYYNHDYDVFLKYLDEAVVWYGPREGQYIVGKSNLEEQLKKVNRNVKFKVENIQTRLFTFSAGLYCVIMTYTLYSLHPNGEVKQHLQRVTFNGRKCRDNNGRSFWLCPYIEVSNLIPEGNDTGVKTSLVSAVEDKSKRLFFTSKYHTTICLNESSIRYIEGGKGVCSNIYTDDAVHTVNTLLKDLQKQLPSNFYRCHMSYIVNVDRISSISSNRITLIDGTEIPIPVKKAVIIKKEIEELMNS